MYSKVRPFPFRPYDTYDDGSYKAAKWLVVRGFGFDLIEIKNITAFGKEIVQKEANLVI